MTNTKEQTPEEQRRQFQHEAQNPANDKVQMPTEIELRHYGPIQTALPNESTGYEWKRETGDIQSYRHDHTGGWLHIDPQANFYDREAQLITKENALDHAAHEPSHTVTGKDNDQGLGL